MNTARALNPQRSAFGWLCLCIVLCALTLSISGCKATDTAPSPGRGDWYPAPMNDPQISMLSPELRNWLLFQPAVVIKDGHSGGGGPPMHVEVPMRNSTYNKYQVEYRFLFYDENGREQEPLIGWTHMSLEPKQIVRLKASALSNTAESYRLEVKWSR